MFAYFNDALVLILLVVVFFVGLLSGIAWYRYQLRNHPEKLEQWINQSTDTLRSVKKQAEETIEREVAELQERKERLLQELNDLTNRLR